MDYRDRIANFGLPYDSFDEKRMKISFTTCDDEWDDITIELPVVFEVCSYCDGKGSQVNPSIDSHGLTAEDFREDPDFAENYFGGMYDEHCCQCDGRRVEPVVDEARCKPEDLKKWHEHLRARADEIRERESEMRWGY